MNLDVTYTTENPSSLYAKHVKKKHTLSTCKKLQHVNGRKKM
jgi:hypothetical protein